MTLIVRVVGLVVVATMLGGLLSVGIGIGTAVAAYVSLTKDLPDPSQVEARFSSSQSDFFETTKIYDRTGKTLLYEVIDPRAGDRQWVSLDQMPTLCKQATIAIEDKSFYENPGFDLYGITRAFISNLQGRAVQGASSITQQVVKNSLIDPEERYKQSYERKVKEALLAYEISRRYSKNQILEWYLNTNFYGNLAYGIDAAARVYFGKPANKLNLAECSMLAAIPQFPAMNPIDNPDLAKERQALVLDAMVRQGYITAEDSVTTKFAKLDVISGGVQARFDIKAPHFAIYVRKWLEDHFGADMVYRGGLRVYTTLDLDLNNQAQQIVAQHVKQLSEDEKNVNNGAVVVIRPRTGEILAMVGSVDYWNDKIDGKFNVATGLRQPGSSFKPLTYVTLLSQGYNPATPFLDVRTAFQQPGFPPYVPENYDRKYHGMVRMRVALARSYNIPAVRALEMAGIDNVIRTAHKMGITTLNRGLDYYGMALTLGGGEVKLTDMVYAFSVFANNGAMAGTKAVDARPGFRTLDPVPVLRVEDRQGVVWEYKQPETQQVLDPRLAYLMSSMLSDNQARWAAFGSPNVLELDRPAAAKTGTTNDFRDNWTIGYTPQVAVGVWVGNTDNSEMKGVTGLTGAAPVWHDVMAAFLKDKPVEPFVRPEGLVEKYVDAVSGLLPTKYSTSIKEYFIPGTEPTSYDNIHQAFLIDKETGKLATVHTPPDKVEEKVFEIYPPEAAEWVAEAKVPQPPNEYDTVYGPPPTAADVAITGPKAYGAIHGGVVITGNAKGGDFALFRVAFGQGMNPSAWTQIGGDHGDQVDNNTLEYWDTAGLQSGLYSLQLTVVDHNQSLRQSTIQVTVDNQAPTIKLTYPSDSEEYNAAKDEWMVVNADVSDNFGIDRVEFFIDVYTQPFSIRYIAPYNDKLVFTTQDANNRPRFRSEVVGNHTVWAVVYDKAGNTVESNKVRVIIGYKK